MNITEFINAPNEEWQNIPRTKLLASSYGRIIHADTKLFFGEIRYFEDLEGILTGEIPVWNTDAVLPTLAPANYFRKRTRHDKENERTFMLEAA